MVKQLLLLIVFIIPVSIFGQDVQRENVKGKITVPKDDDVEGITIYNQSSEKGTITSRDGTFEIFVAENDRILITAIQFQNFTLIVDSGIVNSKKMTIYLNPTINQLSEVVVRPYDLSGNIKVDVNRIPVFSDSLNMDLSYEALNYKYKFTTDQYSSIPGNFAAEALNDHSLVYGFNFKSLLGGILNLLDSKKKCEFSSIKKMADNSLVVKNLIQRFPPSYIKNTFGIPENKTGDFLYFVSDSGLSDELLKDGNEMALFKIIQQKSTEYIARSEKD